MRRQYALTDDAMRELAKLSPEIRERVEKKLRYFFAAEDPMQFAKPLTNMRPATHRFRVWKLRVKFFRQGGIFYITHIDIRDKVYRRKT